MVSWLPIYRQHPELPFYALSPNERHQIYTGETDWIVEIDENGFRYDRSNNASNRCTVLWLGDSYAFGHGVGYAESFIGIIDARSPGVRHINAAVPGYGPIQYRQVLDYLNSSHLKYDSVFVATYVGNDFHDTKWGKNRAVVDGIIGNRAGVKSFLKRKSHLYRLIASVYHRLAPLPATSFSVVMNQLASPDAWREDFLISATGRYERELEKLQVTAKSRGAGIGFLILPTSEAVASTFSRPEEVSVDRQPLLPVKKAIEILERLDTDYLDLTPVLARHPREDVFFSFDGHLTKTGNRLVADAFLQNFSIPCGATAR